MRSCSEIQTGQDRFCFQYAPAMLYYVSTDNIDYAVGWHSVHLVTK